MILKKLITYSFSAMILGNILLASTIFLLTKNQNELNEAYEKRYQSYLAADELRQSSDDLTRFARTYVVSSEPKYESMYWDILAIRNGTKPRPENYNRIYWDLVLNYGDKPRPDTQKIPLETIMKNLGFTATEFGLLKKAQENSNSLVGTETIAMNAMKGFFLDKNGDYSVKGSADKALAQRIMHDNKYHEDKFKIMKPIDTFFQSLDIRTKGTTQSLKKIAAEFSFSAKIISALLIIGSLVLGIYVSKYITRKVGGDPSEIESIANEIAKGNFRTHQEKTTDGTGILKALEKMSQSLKDDAEKKISINWLKESSLELNTNMRGDLSLTELGKNICSILSQKLGASVGVFYVTNPDNSAKAIASYAIKLDELAIDNILPGEGLVGEVILTKESSLFDKVPKDYMSIESGIIDGTPRSILIFPFILNGRVEAIIELGTVTSFSALHLSLLKQESQGIVINVSSNQAKTKLHTIQYKSV